MPRDHRIAAVIEQATGQDALLGRAGCRALAVDVGSEGGLHLRLKGMFDDRLVVALMGSSAVLDASNVDGVA